MKINENEDLFKILIRFKKVFFSELVIKNVSKHTINTYSKILDEFLEYVFCENNFNTIYIKDFNKYFILGYINELKKRKLSASTLNLHLKVIKVFLKFISENNDNGIDILYPIEKITIKQESKEIITFTNYEFNKIKSYLFDFLDKSKNYDRYKNALCLAVIAFTGLRADECLSIKNENIEIMNQNDEDFIRIKINGKGNKERYIYLDEVFIPYLDKLNTLKQKLNINSELTFAKKDGSKMSYNNLFNYNKRILNKLYINPKKSGLHIYRHTFASNLTENNINLETIKDILGHSSISITSKYYAKTSEKAKQNAMLYHSSNK